MLPPLSIEWTTSEFVRELRDRNIPTLGICFGHQLINEALGGHVEHQGLQAELVEADLTNDPLFKGVSSTLPALHGDVVVEAGGPMDTIASADGYEHFATRHAEAPIWTTQYHPEFTSRLHERIAQDIGWHENHLSFEAVTGAQTLVNFAQFVERYDQ